MNPRDDIPKALAYLYEGTPAERHHVIHSLYTEDASYHHSLVRQTDVSRVHKSAQVLAVVGVIDR